MRPRIYIKINPRRNLGRNTRKNPGNIKDLWSELFQRGERWLIRGLILASVALVVFQLGSAGDPVQLYLAMAEKVESPAIPVGSGFDTEQYTVTFRVSPAAPVKLIQNDQIIASLDQDQTVSVSEGLLILDARGIKEKVTVQVLETDGRMSGLAANQLITLENNFLSTTITVKK